MEEGQIEVGPTCSAHRESAKVHELLECYNDTREYKEEQEQRNVQVPKTKGEHDVVGTKL
jgi:hypothetical protein